MKTVVCQSYRSENVPPWMKTCLESVQGWAALKGWDYRFEGDEFLGRVPGWYRENAGGRLPVISDLARLLFIRDLLDEGYARVIWLDADLLVFDPAGLDVEVAEEFAFGRENWVQADGKGGLRLYRNVHNAISVFAKGNSFLDFYIYACRSVVGRLRGGGPNQVVGPKLLTSLHNTLGFSLIESVGAFSPLVLGDIATGGGPALDLLKGEQKETLRAANLCASQDVAEDVLEAVCKRLLARKKI